MPNIPASITEQLPVAALLLLGIYVMWREFRAFIDRSDTSQQQRDKQWQEYLKQQRADDQLVTRDLISEIKSLTQIVVDLRADFDNAVATMKERTRPAERVRRRGDNP